MASLYARAHVQAAKHADLSALSMRQLDTLACRIAMTPALDFVHRESWDALRALLGEVRARSRRMVNACSRGKRLARMADRLESVRSQADFIRWLAGMARKHRKPRRADGRHGRITTLQNAVADAPRNLARSRSLGTVGFTAYASTMLDTGAIGYSLHGVKSSAYADIDPATGKRTYGAFTGVASGWSWALVSLV